MPMPCWSLKERYQSLPSLPLLTLIHLPLPLPPFPFFPHLSPGIQYFLRKFLCKNTTANRQIYHHVSKQCSLCMLYCTAAYCTVEQTLSGQIHDICQRSYCAMPRGGVPCVYVSCALCEAVLYTIQSALVEDSILRIRRLSH
jgi:hypothetical protein